MNSGQRPQNQVRTLSGVALTRMQHISVSGKTLFGFSEGGAWVEGAGGGGLDSRDSSHDGNCTAKALPQQVIKCVTQNIISQQGTDE